ncbi:MAG: hypothetical protein ACR2RE_08815 [Geminicoccaceae bacterium]
MAVQFLLESALVPILAAGALGLAARTIVPDRARAGVLALAVLLAVGTTYVLAFSWPSTLVLNARTKIMFSAFIGIAIGMAIEHRLPWSTIALAALAIAVPLWIGLPALQQGRLESILLIPIIAAALFAPRLMGDCRSWGEPPKVLTMMALALGLAGIAAFARSLSFAELSLALASALLAIILIGPRPLSATAAIATAPILLALTAALLLYSNASLPALLVLSTVIGAEPLARRSSGREPEPVPTRRVLLYCLLPTAAAILIARIDGGSISIY